MSGRVGSLGHRSTHHRLIRALGRFGRPALRVVAGLFYRRDYLVGRYFDEGLTGWVWVLKGLIFQKLLGFNRRVPWPVSPRVEVVNPERIHFSPDDLHNFQTFGCYFQAIGGEIHIGRGTRIAPNVGLITANHDIQDLSNHLGGGDIRIGHSSWIGMNAVVLPGVTLGPRTIVGAGAVVTKSYPEGSCVLVGVPARIAKHI